MLPGCLIQQQALSKHGDFGPKNPLRVPEWAHLAGKDDKKGGGREIPQTQIIETHTSEKIQADVGAGSKWSY